MVKSSAKHGPGIAGGPDPVAMNRSGRWTGYNAMARHLVPAARHLLARVVVAAESGPGSRSSAGPLTLLDVGAGTGEGLSEARALGWRPVGLDLSADQLSAGRSAGAPLVQADAHRCPFASETFDAAISNFALIFAADPTTVIDEVRRCLRPGAAFSFTAWTPGGWPGPCRAILASELGRSPMEFPTSLGQDDAAKSLLVGHGFTDVGIEHGRLGWEFDDIDDATETLTAIAGGLRVLRAALESDGRWVRARVRLAEHLALHCHPTDSGVALDEYYLVAYGTRR